MPDETTQTTEPGAEALEDRIAKLVKSTVAGHMGSLREDVGGLREMLQKQEDARKRADIARLTPEQAKEYALKTLDAEPSGDRPKVDVYFKRQAQALIEDAGVDVEVPSWEAGKPVSFYEDAFADFRRTVFESLKKRNTSEAVAVAEAKVKEILHEKGLDITDAGSVTGGGSTPGKMTRQQLRDMTPEQYEKSRDALFSE